MGARTRGIANNILSDGLDATDGLSGALSSSNITNASVTNVTSTPSIGGGFEKVASDPPSPTEGDIWYNTTSNSVKGYVYRNVPPSFSTGGTLPVGRGDTAGAGTKTAGLLICGYNPTNTNTCNEYTSSTWTSAGSTSNARYYHGGTGTQTAAVTGSWWTGGAIGNGTEEYNGSSWSSAPSQSTGRLFYTMGGTQTASYIAGGDARPSEPVTNKTEEYNGSSWTSGGNLPAAVASRANIGPTTAGMSLGPEGHPSGNPSVLLYDGTTWTSASGTMIEAARTNRAAGTQTDAFSASGPNSTERWDGTSWCADASYSTTGGRTTANQDGGATVLMSGSGPAGYFGDTEEYEPGSVGVLVSTLG